MGIRDQGWVALGGFVGLGLGGIIFLQGRGPVLRRGLVTDGLQVALPARLHLALRVLFLDGWDPSVHGHHFAKGVLFLGDRCGSVRVPWPQQRATV